jgi:hypothetical protein
VLARRKHSPVRRTNAGICELDVGMVEWSVKGFATDLTPELVRTLGALGFGARSPRNCRAVGSVAAGVPKVLERNPGGGVGSAGTGRVKS